MKILISLIASLAIGLSVASAATGSTSTGSTSTGSTSTGSTATGSTSTGSTSTGITVPSTPSSQKGAGGPVRAWNYTTGQFELFPQCFPWVWASDYFVMNLVDMYSNQEICRVNRALDFRL